MLAAPTIDWLPTPADSAHAAAEVYRVSLAATVPLIAAAIAAILVRRLPAGTRSLVWRSAVVALLMVFFGREVPVHWMAWVVPSWLASPLIVLGGMQLGPPGHEAQLTRAFGLAESGSNGAYAAVVRLLLLLYWSGVLMVLFPLVRAWLASRASARGGRPVLDAGWLAMLHDARSTLGIRRPVRLLVTEEANVPVTWGVLRPVVMLPTAVLGWGETERRGVLLHELAHVRAADALFGIASRVMCGLYWFHPGAWWIARGLRAECEFACDDRVLASGVRASSYAELLMRASDTLRSPRAIGDVSLAISHRAGLRARLAAVVDTRRDIRAPARASVMAAIAATMIIAGPASVVRLAPTRGVLTTLMRDSRWESRAYAVLGLAGRPDSIAATRAAASLDPSPRVRAWARYALTLGTEGGAPMAAPLLEPR